MRVHLDHDRCREHGQCVYAAPAVFGWADDGSIEVLDHTPPDSMRSEVVSAAGLCPELAIVIEDDPADA